jgi:hypothetical protein
VWERGCRVRQAFRHASGRAVRFPARP